MRIAFYGLLLANLGLLAASQWLAPSSPPAPPVASGAAASGEGAAGSAAPRRILLASERPAATTGGAGGEPVAAPGSAAADAGAADGAAMTPDLAPASADGAQPVSATAALAASATSGATTVAATGASLAVQPGAARCVSLGPFRELEIAAAATVMLKNDGYEPRQRPADGPVPDDYLVVIGGLRSVSDQARIVRRLNRGGLQDAFPLPKLDDGWAVSVGVFSQSQRAERRRLAVARMGLEAKVIERTRPGTVYWLDVDLKPAAPGAPNPAAAWLEPSGPSQALQVVACPQPRSVG